MPETRFSWRREGISASLVTISWTVPDGVPGGWYTIHYSALVCVFFEDFCGGFALEILKEGHGLDDVSSSFQSHSHKAKGCKCGLS